MITLGLTGGIAMGKSTVAAQFKALGAALCSADEMVHALMQPKGAAYADVCSYFPTACKQNSIDRKILGELVFYDKKSLDALEKILHPLVKEEEYAFVKRAKQMGAAVCVLEIPLLFETKGEQRFDYTVAVTAPRFLQRLRALQRPHMNAKKLDSILARQLGHHMRLQKADFIIQTGLGKAYSFRQVQNLMEGLS